MISGLLPSLRFARSWNSPAGELLEREVLIPLPSGEQIPGTLIEHPGSPRPSRGWVVLHGMTRRGRGHSELLRFLRALAATGGRILVPEIREWMELRFAPERSQEILRGAVEWLGAAPGTAQGGIMVAGLSFGAPQAILAASDPALAPRLRGVLAWGGYADLGRTFRFSFTGEHSWDGEIYRQEPEPYVRWVIGANCLPLSMGEAGLRVGEALRTLAAAAGDSQSSGADPRHASMKCRLREELPSGDHGLFDLFVPRHRGEPDRSEAEALVEELLPAIRRADPLLEPLQGISRIEVPIRILHGRSDHLIPFTEALHMERTIAPITMDTTVRITGLFSHSGEDRTGSPFSRGREAIRFLDALRGVFRLG